MPWIALDCDAFFAAEHTLVCAPSEQTAALLGGRARLWITNEFQHSGLRDDPSVFERLLAMSKGEVAIPS